MNNPAEFDFACPICRSRLEPISLNELHCAVDDRTYSRIDGVWRMMRPGRSAHYEQFVKEYETIRQAEGRGSDDAAYYRALPFADLTGAMTHDWRIRAASFRALVETLVTPLEASHTMPLKILDLGAGNGWLSYQLAKRGHSVGAVDLLTNRRDGLGAFVYYDAPFTPIQAEFDYLPLTDNQIDLVIFNSSLHYSTNYELTLCEAWRVAKRNGHVVVLDSPVYSDAESGKQMVSERQQQFVDKYGFPSDSIASENYLTLKRLNALAASTQTKWRFVKPSYGWRWAMRPWVARLRRHREPARFMLIIGTREETT